MSYTARDIRNVCLIGHGGDGKTALAESMLYYTKGTDRLGKSAEGTTVSDFDPEEIKRKYSISTSIIPIEYGKSKINLFDNPGYFDFAGEVMQSIRVVDSGVIVVSAKNGIGVGTVSYTHLSPAPWDIRRSSGRRYRARSPDCGTAPVPEIAPAAPAL